MPRTDFLADAGPLIAAVQPARQVAVFVFVLGNVGIEQKQRDAAHVDAQTRARSCPSAW